MTPTEESLSPVAGAAEPGRPGETGGDAEGGGGRSGAAAETMAALSEILFVMWGYPEPTQTFIHREMRQLAAEGARLQVLAGERVHHDDVDPTTAELAERALYLGDPAAILLRSSRWALRHSRQFGRLLGWAVRLPHRTVQHRLRMVAMAYAAASVVERVQASGRGYLHAHFASYQTEWTACLSRLTGIPYGFTAHATDIWKDANLLGEKIRGARVVLSCTQHNVQRLRELAPEAAGRVHLVRHGLDLAAIGPAVAPAPLETPRWVSVGRLVEKKGFGHLIDAVAELKARGSRAQILLIGGGPAEAALRRRVAERDLADRVIFRGSVPNAEVLATVSGATGLVVPSVRAANGDLDGIPNVILEAAALGRPVIASRLSGIPEAVIDGETGLLVPPGDVAALAGAMLALEQSPERARAFGRAGRALIERDYDVVVNTRRHADLLARARRSSGPVLASEAEASPGPAAVDHAH